MKSCDIGVCLASQSTAAAAPRMFAPACRGDVPSTLYPSTRSAGCCGFRRFTGSISVMAYRSASGRHRATRVSWCPSLARAAHPRRSMTLRQGRPDGDGGVRGGKGSTMGNAERTLLAPDTEPGTRGMGLWGVRKAAKQDKNMQSL